MISLHKILSCFLIFMISVLLFCGCKADNEKSSVLYQMDENIVTQGIRINIEGYEPISFRVYGDAEPEAVDKFISLCDEGFYNGTDFFNIIDGYLLMAGKKENSVTVGKAQEQNRLFPLYGALCVSLNGETTCELGNFYIIGSSTENLDNINELLEFRNYDFKDYLKFGYDTELTDEELSMYRQYGGAPWLQGHTVVLGQAYEGLDVINRIFEEYKEDSSRQFIITCIDTY